MASYGDDNSLLSTTVYGEFIVADVPPDFPGFSGNAYIPQYAYAQFDRNVSVFGNIYCRQLLGFSTDARGNIVSTGALNLSGSSVNVTGNLVCGGVNYSTLVPSIYGNVSALQTAVSTLAPKASPTFTGTVTIPTPATADNSTTAVNSAWVKSQGYITSSGFNGYSANNTWSGSNSFTGSLTAITPASTDSSTTVATTAYVKAQGYSTSSGTTLAAVQSNNNTWTGTNAFSSTVTVPTAATSDNSTNAASTAFVKNQGYITSSGFNGYGANNTWTGTNTFSSTTTVPTAATSDNSTNAASTAFVKNQSYAPLSSANTFTAQQTFSAGTNLENQQLRLRTSGDGNHYLAYSSNVDGAELSGYGGGRLGYGPSSSFTERLKWNSTGVVVSGTLTINDNISANGQTVTPTQLGYLSGASSNIQTQLNGKPVSSGSYSGKNFCQTNNIFSVTQMDINNSGTGQQFPSSSVSTLWNLTGGGAEADFVNCVPNSGYLGAGFQFYNVAADATLAGGSTPFAILRPGTSVLTGSLSVGTGISINNGGLNIIESTGNTGSETSGTIMLQHNNGPGASSIVFKSAVNTGSDSAYIRYKDDVSNQAGYERSRLEIGTTNDYLGVCCDAVSIQKDGAPTYIGGAVFGSWGASFKNSIGCKLLNGGATGDGQGNSSNVFSYSTQTLDIYKSYDGNSNLYGIPYLYMGANPSSYTNCDGTGSASARGTPTYVTAFPPSGSGDGVDAIVIFPNFGVQAYSSTNYSGTCVCDCFNNTTAPIVVQVTSNNNVASLRLVYGAPGAFTMV